MTNSSLGGFDTVFCNSFVGLNRAYDEGLAKDARILTLAPAMAIEGPANVQPLEQVGKEDLRADFAASLLEFTKVIYDTLSNDTETARFALTASRQAIKFHRTVFRLLDLSNDDFTSPRLVIEMKMGDALLDAALASPVTDILKGNPELRSVFYQASVPKSVDAMRPPLLNWLYLTNIHELKYRLLRRWWRGRLPGVNRRRIIVVSSNELVSETASSLAGLGYALLHQQAPKPPSKIQFVDEKVIEKALLLIRDVTKSYLQKWVAENAIVPCLTHFEHMVRGALSEQIWSVEAWGDILGPQLSAGRSAVLVNCPMSPVMIGLSEYCQANNVPLIACQHGVTREVCATHDQYMVNFENSVTDLFLAFNDSTKRTSEASPFARGTTVVTGMPAHYSSLTRFQKASQQPILYVSTCLYSGNVNALNGHLSDIGRCRRELDIVDRMLADLPHRVMYKTYPSGNRYADPDPVMKRLEAAKNIDVFDQPLNLKNIIGKHRVIVTSRATSTLSMCLMSRRPLVFIDMPDHAPLRPELKDEFKASLFLFDYADADVLEKLKAFLSRPIDTIEAEWGAKASARERLIRQHFEGPGGGAGKRGAEAVHRLVLQSERNAE